MALMAGASSASPFETRTVEVDLHHGETDLTITLVLPAPFQFNTPAVVFLPGIMADVDQYMSYAEDLTKQGIVVAIHPWYSLLTSDIELAHHAKIMADWLHAALHADQTRTGIAGHSMGGKDAVLAEGVYGGFKAIVAIDPDDSGDISAIDIYTPRLKTPLLLIGAELGWDAPDFCAPLSENYQRFFEQAPIGTIEITLIGADHVLMLDDPERFGYGVCRTGWADPKMAHDTTMKATTAFFVHYLLNGPDPMGAFPKDALRIKGISDNLFEKSANP